MKYCEKCMKPLDEDMFCPTCGILAAAPLHHIRPGTILRQKYLVGRAFREDSMTISYLARDLSCDQVVVLQEFFPAGQVLRNHLQSNTVGEAYFQEKAMERFLEKAGILQTFGTSACMQQVIDYFRDQNTAYMVLEHCTGVSMKRYLEKKGAIPPAALLQQMEPALKLLDELHQRGILHRRLCPENILFYPDGTVKLVNFAAASKTAEGIGPFTPPEQYEGDGPCGPHSDVYALCATLYTAITGTAPQLAADRLQEDGVKSPSDLGIAMDDGQEAALMMGLFLDTAYRMQSVQALMRAMNLSVPELAQELPAETDRELKQREAMIFTGMPVLEEAQPEEEKLIDPVENHGKVSFYSAPDAQYQRMAEPSFFDPMTEQPGIAEETETDDDPTIFIPTLPQQMPVSESVAEEEAAQEVLDVEPETISDPDAGFTPVAELDLTAIKQMLSAPDHPTMEQTPVFVPDAVTQTVPADMPMWQPMPEEVPYTPWEEYPEEPAERKGTTFLIIAITALVVVLAGLVGMFFWLRSEKGMFGGEKEAAAQIEMLPDAQLAAYDAYIAE